MSSMDDGAAGNQQRRSGHGHRADLVGRDQLQPRPLLERTASPIEVSNHRKVTLSPFSSPQILSRTVSFSGK
jgi:hypothetical protein